MITSEIQAGCECLPAQIVHLLRELKRQDGWVRRLK